MGVSREVERAAMHFGFVGDLGRVDEGNETGISWHLGERGVEVVRAVEVWIIDAHEVEGIRAAPKLDGLIDQHTNPSVLVVDDLLDEVVVSEDAKHPELAIERTDEALDLPMNPVVGAVIVISEVSGDDTEIELKRSHPRDEPFEQPHTVFRIDVDMQVR